MRAGIRDGRALSPETSAGWQPRAGIVRLGQRNEYSLLDTVTVTGSWSRNTELHLIYTCRRARRCSGSASPSERYRGITDDCDGTAVLM